MAEHKVKIRQVVRSVYETVVTVEAESPEAAVAQVEKSGEDGWGDVVETDAWDRLDSSVIDEECFVEGVDNG